MKDRLASANTVRNADPFAGTIGDELDRVEILAGKIGMNSAEQAFSILHKLDDISSRLPLIENDQSRKTTQTQFNAVRLKIEKEASQFLRDLGGAGELKKARALSQPPVENRWWYLDETLASRRKAAFNRGMVTLGAMLLALLVLGVIYQNFLAPDPEVTARYAHEQASRDLMMAGNLEAALEEVDQGLTYGAQDPALLVYRGVILENLNRTEEARQSFALAEKSLEKREDFLVTRGQAYSMVGQMEKAAADAADAIAINPDFAQAYLLAGQVNEMTRNFRQAMTDYENAYSAAERSNQIELAALARTRLAMMMQVMNVQAEFTEEPETE